MVVLEDTIEKCTDEIKGELNDMVQAYHANKYVYLGDLARSLSSFKEVISLHNERVIERSQ